MAEGSTNAEKHGGPPFRVGLGYDIHRVVRGRALVLGGVKIPAPFGLEGHSDADCLSHAIADALLGSLGLPDIGHFFPNNDPSLKGMSSLRILERAVAELRQRGWVIGNVDAMLIAERPVIAPYRQQMIDRLAEALDCTPAQVGIKATTNEGQDAIGRGEAMAAHAVALVCRDTASA